MEKEHKSSKSGTKQYRYYLKKKGELNDLKIALEIYKKENDELRQAVWFLRQLLKNDVVFVRKK